MAEEGRSNYFILLTGQFTGRRGNTHIIIVETQFRRRNIIGGIICYWPYLLPCETAPKLHSAPAPVGKFLGRYQYGMFLHSPFHSLTNAFLKWFMPKNNSYHARTYSSHVQIWQGGDDGDGYPPLPSDFAPQMNMERSSITGGGGGARIANRASVERALSIPGVIEAGWNISDIRTVLVLIAL